MSDETNTTPEHRAASLYGDGSNNVVRMSDETAAVPPADDRTWAPCVLNVTYPDGSRRAFDTTMVREGDRWSVQIPAEAKVVGAVLSVGA